MHGWSWWVAITGHTVTRDGKSFRSLEDSYVTTCSLRCWPEDNWIVSSLASATQDKNLSCFSFILSIFDVKVDRSDARLPASLDHQLRLIWQWHAEMIVKRQTETVLVSFFNVHVKSKWSVFYDELTRQLSSSQFSERENLHFRGFTVVYFTFICMFTKWNRSVSFLENLWVYFVSSLHWQLAHICRLKARGATGLSPLEVQSGITRQDGPGLAR